MTTRVTNPRPSSLRTGTKTRKTRAGPGGLPTRQEIIDFIAASPTPVGKREVARAFKVGSADRVALKGLMKDIERSGLVERGPARRLAPPDRLPEIVVLKVAELDDEGLPVLRPIGTETAESPPEIRLVQRPGETALGVGERAIMRLTRTGDSYDAQLVRRLARDVENVLGVFWLGRDGAGQVVSAERGRRSTSYQVRASERAGAEDGELVLCEPLPLPRLGLPHVQVLERLGLPEDPRSISLMAIHREGIPVTFAAEALAEAEAATPVALGTRTDLRSLPLVTIDGADARDFDDAVFAEPDPERDGGWHAVVAIADVAWYVRPGSALDEAARERGNSVYFPDRVVPMLPEALSNELCSLKPHVERACVAFHLWIDAEGNLHKHQLVRGLMKSVARLTYEQVQAAIDGQTDETTVPLVAPILQPLYGVFKSLERARDQRGTLELDLPERRVVLGEDGKIAAIQTRARLDSHKLIEELMISANVAAAETLQRLQVPGLYRVHDAPDPAKLEALSAFLENLDMPGLKLARGTAVKPSSFKRILAGVVGRSEAPLVNELVLRSQAQAIYTPQNIGHFGLALRGYSHFTSPIRRYSDLAVHRSLLSALMPEKGDGFTEDLAELGAHLSRTERRAAAAERAAVDRYIVLFMAEHVGTSFPARISGVARFGLFAALSETGADGLIPMSSLGQDFYHHDAEHHRLIGQRSGRVYMLGDLITVRLVEADKVKGSLLFALEQHEPQIAPGSAPRAGSARKIAGKAPNKQGRPKLPKTSRSSRIKRQKTSKKG